VAGRTLHHLSERHFPRLFFGTSRADRDSLPAPPARSLLHVSAERSSLVALAHLGAVNIQDERMCAYLGGSTPKARNSAMCFAVLLRWSSPG